MGIWEWHIPKKENYKLNCLPCWIANPPQKPFVLLHFLKMFSSVTKVPNQNLLQILIIIVVFSFWSWKFVSFYLFIYLFIFGLKVLQAEAGVNQLTIVL